MYDKIIIAPRVLKSRSDEYRVENRCDETVFRWQALRAVRERQPMNVWRACSTKIAFGFSRFAAAAAAAVVTGNNTKE